MTQYIYNSISFVICVSSNLYTLIGGAIWKYGINEFIAKCAIGRWDLVRRGRHLGHGLEGHICPLAPLFSLCFVAVMM